MLHVEQGQDGNWQEIGMKSKSAWPSAGACNIESRPPLNIMSQPYIDASSLCLEYASPPPQSRHDWRFIRGYRRNKPAPNRLSRQRQEAVASARLRAPPPATTACRSIASSPSSSSRRSPPACRSAPSPKPRRISSTTRALSAATTASACSGRSSPSSPAAWPHPTGCSRARPRSRPMPPRSRAPRRNMAYRRR